MDLDTKKPDEIKIYVSITNTDVIDKKLYEGLVVKKIDGKMHIIP
jgi:hypothetical protein